LKDGHVDNRGMQRIRTATARRTAGAIVVATWVFLSVAAVFTVLKADYSGHNNFDLVYIPVMFLGTGIYLWVGRLIVTRQPTNTIGWLLLAIPLIASFSFANGSYATRALVTAPGTLPFGRLSAWIDRWAIVPMLAAFIPIFLLYPNGHLPSRRWRPVLWLTIAAPVVTIVAFALTPGRMTGGMAELETVDVTNPFGVGSAGSLINLLTQIGGWATFASGVGACAAIVVRYRRADGEVRQQVRWLAFIGVAFFAELILGLIGAAVTNDSDLFGNLMFLLWFLTLVIGMPVACGVAILRYRLYDLDVVVKKTVVYGLLGIFITAVYVLIVGGIGALVGSRSSGALSFAAAAVLAVLFQPARDRARRVADRLVYGTRASPYEVLADFSIRVGESYDADDVLPRMANILATGTGASSATIWLRVGNAIRPSASWPDPIAPRAVALDSDALPALGDEHATEVRHRGELLGALSVAMPASDPMNPIKEKLVADLAGQAGLVLRNVRLIEELRASRQRLVAAQDEERRKIERNIHDGAQQQLVALAVKQRIAASAVGRDDDRARAILEELQVETSQALEDLRDLARGVYPPLLADQGLAAALKAQARKSAVPVEVTADGVGRFPQEIEAAVYFSCLEALQNVAKYAEASNAVIRLAHVDGELTFEVEDDGKGFDASSTGYGTGLQGMADRLDALGGTIKVRSTPESGTTITGVVPGGDRPS
jgi:signal transduction histidine kinase